MGDWRDGDDYHQRDLPHIDPWERTVFVTFCTWKRWVMPGAARDLVLARCRHDHGHWMWLHAAVVMPDHVHLPMTPIPRTDGHRRPLSRLLHGIKGASAHSVNRLLARHGPVWQDESFDHILRSDESRLAKAEYIVANPVRSGLAAEPDDYPWIWRATVEGQSDS